MPYYNRDPKRDDNFDNHPMCSGFGVCRSKWRSGPRLGLGLELGDSGPEKGFARAPIPIGSMVVPFWDDPKEFEI